MGGELVQESHACPWDGGEGCEQDRQQIPEPSSSLSQTHSPILSMSLRSSYCWDWRCGSVHGEEGAEPGMDV